MGKTLPEDPQSPATAPVETSLPQPVPWRLFWLLALVVLLAALLGLPYALQVFQAGDPQLAGQADAMRRSVVLRAVLQAILLYWPLTLLGLIAAGRIGLGLPFLSAWNEGRSPSLGIQRILRPAAWLGFGTGFAILIISAVLSPWTAGELTRLNAGLSRASLPGAWQSFFASLSAGVNEEILLRLFLLSALAWGLQRLFTRRRFGRPGLKILWAANLIAALVFGLLHLPNLSALNVPVSPYLLAITVSLNGAAGLGFGWLYWNYGLEAASLAHFFMDLVLHVLPALLLARPG